MSIIYDSLSLSFPFLCKFESVSYTEWISTYILERTLECMENMRLWNPLINVNNVSDIYVCDPITL